MYSLIILLASLNGHTVERIDVKHNTLLECNNAKSEVLAITPPKNQTVLVKCVKS